MIRIQWWIMLEKPIIGYSHLVTLLIGSHMIYFNHLVETQMHEKWSPWWLYEHSLQTCIIPHHLYINHICYLVCEWQNKEYWSDKVWFSWKLGNVFGFSSEVAILEIKFPTLSLKMFLIHLKLHLPMRY